MFLTISDIHFEHWFQEKSTTTVNPVLHRLVDLIQNVEL